MLFSYLLTNVAPGDGEIKEMWGYKFRWSDKHLTEEQLRPARYTYDKVGDEVLERVRAHQRSKSANDGVPATQAAGHREDLYESLKNAALANEDEELTKFWHDIHNVPDWVDWDQIKRGQEVRNTTYPEYRLLTKFVKVFYRYGESALTGLTFSSLLGGMVSKVLCAYGQLSNKLRLLDELLKHWFEPEVLLQRLHESECTL